MRSAARSCWVNRPDFEVRQARRPICSWLRPVLIGQPCEEMACRRGLEAEHPALLPGPAVWNRRARLRLADSRCSDCRWPRAADSMRASSSLAATGAAVVCSVSYRHPGRTSSAGTSAPGSTTLEPAVSGRARPHSDREPPLGRCPRATSLVEVRCRCSLAPSGRRLSWRKQRQTQGCSRLRTNDASCSHPCKLRRVLPERAIAWGAESAVSR